MRSSACSRRRRSPPAAPMMLVISAARTTPGMPRKRNNSCAYSASFRAPSSWAARLLPTTPAPESLASRFLARAVTLSNAAAGSGGSAPPSRTWYWVYTAAGWVRPSWAYAPCHWAAGSSSTLSGGACSDVPGGAPTAWNIESRLGRLTMPWTRTRSGGSPGRATLTSVPTVACRFAAVCWASTTPSRAPSSERIWPGNVLAYPGGTPSTMPAPVVCTVPPAVAVNPGVWA